jgi:5-methylcytosine-specific restriction endonuclease McrA
MVTKWNKNFTTHRTGCNKCSGTGWKLLSNQDPVWCDCRPKKFNLKDKHTKERGKLTPKMRVAVLERDRWVCRMCGSGSAYSNNYVEGTELEVDHIHPVSDKGKTTMDNLQTLCKPCNRGKGSRQVKSDVDN